MKIEYTTVEYKNMWRKIGFYSWKSLLISIKKADLCLSDRRYHICSDEVPLDSYLNL
jgi:hypothetical protein